MTKPPEKSAQVAALDSAGERALPPRPKVHQRLLRDKRAMVGLIALLVIIFSTIFAAYISPYDPLSQEFDLLQPPSPTHPLGTDDLGRDLFTRILYGARVSLFVGIVAVSLSMVLGVAMGILSGYYGGWIDIIFMRYIDLQWAFPNFIIAVYLVAVFGTGLENVIVAITLAFLDDFARITRGMVLSIREREYVLAARLGRRVRFAHYAAAHPAQRDCPYHRASDAQRLFRHLGGGGAVFSWFGREANDADLGFNYQRCAQLFHPRLVVGHLSGPGDYGDCAEHQFFWRCPARCA